MVDNVKPCSKTLDMAEKGQKHSSLFVLSVSDECKSFMRLKPEADFIKLFLASLTPILVLPWLKCLEWTQILVSIMPRYF